MSRTCSSALASWLPTSNSGWVADLVTVTLLSGTVYRWATCAFDFAPGDGYTYTSGPLISSSMRQGSQLEVDTHELNCAGTYKIGGSTISLLATQGLFDDARVQTDRVIGAYPGDISLGMLSKRFEGRVAEVEPTPTTLKLSVAGEIETLSFLQLPKFLYQASCGNTVYDSNCGLSRATYTVSGTVSGGTGLGRPPQFSASGAAAGQPAGYFNLGVVQFGLATATQALRGVRRTVSDFRIISGIADIILGLPLPVACQAGDTFTAYPGCARTLAACTAFSNLARFRGFPRIPASEANG